MGILIGRKIGMTQSFGEDGQMIPVTVIQAGPCRVVEQRSTDKHGYSAAVIAFEEIPGAKAKKPRLGFFKKLSSPVYRIIREFRDAQGNVGEDLTVAQFTKGETLTVEGISIGKGWASVIKKWNFSRGRESHGGNFNRAPGSIGMHTWPARTLPGKKMSGRMGNEKVTLKSVEVVDVIPEENLLLVKGPVPGVDQALLKICTSKFQRKKKAA